MSNNGLLGKYLYIIRYNYNNYNTTINLYNNSTTTTTTTTTTTNYYYLLLLLLLFIKWQYSVCWTFVLNFERHNKDLFWK